MPDEATEPGVWTTPLDRQRRRRLRLAGLIVGALLVAAAVIVLATRSNDLRRALDALASPSPAALAALALSVVGSTVLTAIVLLVLIRRHGRVRFVEMMRLVCASTLGNFLPLQPGLAGRVAYHHLVNRIAVRHSVLSIVEASIVSAVAVGLLLASLWITRAGPLSPQSGVVAMPWWTVTLAGLLALPLLPWPKWRPFAVALLARWADLLLWALRSWACFLLVGVEISPHEALAFACVAMSANLVPFIGNGLGVREWAIGLLATPLAGIPVEAGLAAELVGRAAEIVFFVPAGLMAGRGITRTLHSVLTTQRAEARRAAT